jgi:hypothetical protein
VTPRRIPEFGGVAAEFRMAFGAQLSAFGKSIMWETAASRQPNADSLRRHCQLKRRSEIKDDSNE